MPSGTEDTTAATASTAQYAGSTRATRRSAYRRVDGGAVPAARATACGR